MADEAIVRISKDKPTELEFQVVVKGAEDLAADTLVRFVIAKVDNNHDMVFHATRGDGDTWRVDLPPLEHLGNGTYDVRIEVIIDNYYFEPAQGQVVLLSEPRIIITSAHETADGKKVEERAPGAGIAFGGMEAPTTNLLKPEAQPPSKHVEKDEETEDEKEELPFTVKPGESIQEPQDDGKEEDDKKKGFNPQRVAERIIMDTLGLSKRQRQQIAQKPGFLFKRDADGKPVVAALSDPEIQKRLRERQAHTKEEKVKALLKELAN